MSPSCSINWSRTTPTPSTARSFRRFPTSIETLDPNSPILKSLLAMKPGPGVAYHSIIGSLRPGGVDDSTDGVVPYRSAHLDGVESEKVVRSDHGVQKDGEAIQEVRRILREHIGLAGETARAGREGTVQRGPGRPPRHRHRRPAARAAAGPAAMSEPGHSLAVSRNRLIDSGRGARNRA